jgi:hypothetical protein
MDWYKAMDSMVDRSMETASGKLEFFGRSIVSPPPNYEGPDGESTTLFTLFTISGKFVLAIIAIWLFGYISTIFPYLGTYHYRYADGIRDEHDIGVRNMLLFKGQTAFLEYDINSADRSEGKVYIAIERWRPLGNASDKLEIQGRKKGVLTMPVNKTGFYTFYSGIGIMAYRQNLKYTVTWGAR